MPKQSVPFYALNRGEISRLALMRVDVEKLRLSADTQENFLPLVIGPTTLRPGLGYVGGIYNDAPTKLIGFVYAFNDSALVELTDATMRVWANDALLTRVAVSTTIAAFASWTTSASPTASVSTAGGKLTISGVTQANISYAYAAMSVAGGDHAKEHALRIVVSRGPILFKVGTAQGKDDIVSSTMLDTGTHSIAFTPGQATVYPQFESQALASRIVDSIAIEGAGVLTLPTPWAAADLANIQYDASASVIFVACRGYQQRRIERRTNVGSSNSWSVVLYKSDDGPFPAAQGDKTFLFTPSAQQGDTTITCNKDFFQAGHVGALIRLFHTGQIQAASLNAEDTWTAPIRVSGSATVNGYTSNERVIQIDISGTWAGTVTLQRTFDPDGIADWVDLAAYTMNQTGLTYNDGMYNVIVWYRLGFKPLIKSSIQTGAGLFGGISVTSGYTSGTAQCQLTYKGGGGAGVARVISVTNSKTAQCEVVKPFFNAAVSDDWRLSRWNGVDGWPTVPCLHEGRMAWAGGGRIQCSVSDNFLSFDFDKTGDAAPIDRSIGKGPIVNANWMLSLSRLAVGTDSGVSTVRSSSFDEPLTPTAFNIKYSQTQRTAPLRALAVDQQGAFVNGSGRRVYMMKFSTQAFDYKLEDLTRLNPDIGIPGFVDWTIQRQPDTRFLLVRSDGQLACLLFDDDDDVRAWFRVKTDGVIENVAVLPGTLEDKVYVVVRRTVNGVTKRYLERFARLDECYGDAQCKLADCFGTYSGAPTTTITGLSYLEGKSVVVWGDGKDIGFDPANPGVSKTFTVTGGQITLPVAVSQAVVGLPYTGKFISAKLAYAAAGGTAVNKPKRISQLGVVIDRTHYQGLRLGQYDKAAGTYWADPLPRVESGAAVAADTIHSYYDQQNFPLNGQWDTDSRLYIEAAAPRPATVLGVTVDMVTNG